MNKSIASSEWAEQGKDSRPESGQLYRGPDFGLPEAVRSHTSIRISGKAHGVGNQLNAAIDEVRMILRARPVTMLRGSPTAL